MNAADHPVLIPGAGLDISGTLAAGHSIQLAARDLDLTARVAAASHGNPPSVSSTNRYHAGRGVLPFTLESRAAHCETRCAW